MPPEWILERLTYFILYCHYRGKLIGDGETFRDEDGDWVLLVRHVPPKDPEHPGEVRLKVLFSKEHGIDVKDEARTGGTTGVESKASVRPEPQKQQVPQPMAEPPASPDGAAAQGVTGQRPGMGFGNAGTEGTPAFGGREAPAAGAGDAFADQEPLFGAAREKGDRVTRSLTQAPAHRLGLPKTAIQIFAIFLLIWFMEKSILPFFFD